MLLAVVKAPKFLGLWGGRASSQVDTSSFLLCICPEASRFCQLSALHMLLSQLPIICFATDLKASSS